jgi:Protein of unknown function (DUF3800)
MLYLTSYFDESGDADDPTRHFVGMAGFVAPADSWKNVESEWKAVVNSQEFALKEYFHMKDFAQGFGQFIGWEKPRKHALHKALVKILVRAELVPIGTIVHLEAFNSLTESQRISFKSPYATCAQDCIHSAAIKGFLPWPEKVAMVFARQEHHGAVDARGEDDLERAGNIENLFYAMKKILPIGQWMGAYGSATPQESIPLQAADMLAWELTKEFETILQNPPPRPMRISLRELLRAGGNAPLIRLHDLISLLRTVRISNFPDLTGTEVVDDDSILQMQMRRIAQDILLARREDVSHERYIPKWLEYPLRQYNEEDSIGA